MPGARRRHGRDGRDEQGRRISDRRCMGDPGLRTSLFQAAVSRATVAHWRPRCSMQPSVAHCYDLETIGPCATVAQEQRERTRNPSAPLRVTSWENPHHRSAVHWVPYKYHSVLKYLRSTGTSLHTSTYQCTYLTQRIDRKMDMPEIKGQVSTLTSRGSNVAHRWRRRVVLR